MVKQFDETLVLKFENHNRSGVSDRSVVDGRKLKRTREFVCAYGLKLVVGELPAEGPFTLNLRFATEEPTDDAEVQFHKVKFALRDNLWDNRDRLRWSLRGYPYSLLLDPLNGWLKRRWGLKISDGVQPLWIGAWIWED